MSRWRETAQPLGMGARTGVRRGTDLRPEPARRLLASSGLLPSCSQSSPWCFLPSWWPATQSTHRSGISRRWRRSSTNLTRERCRSTTSGPNTMSTGLSFPNSSCWFLLASADGTSPTRWPPACCWLWASWLCLRTRPGRPSGPCSYPMCCTQACTTRRLASASPPTSTAIPCPKERCQPLCPARPISDFRVLWP